jgi:hypothetical protein
MNHGKIVIIEIAMVMMCVIFGFVHTVALVIAIIFTLGINILYWWLVFDYWVYNKQHNESVISSVDDKKEKVEMLTLDQADDFHKKGFVYRGEDKMPMVNEELWRKHNDGK